MRLSNVLVVLLIGAVLYAVMAIIRAVVIGRMDGMQDEALAYRQKALRAAVVCALLLVAFVLADRW